MSARDALGDLVAGRADLLERAAPWVGELPVDVALAGDVGAGVAAAHRHHHVRLLGQLARQEPRPAVGEVDVQLAHDLHDLRVDALGRRRARAQRAVAAGGGLLEQRGAHLRAAGVVQADEQRRRHLGRLRHDGRARGARRARAGRRARRARRRRPGRRRRSRSRARCPTRAPARTIAPGSSRRR